MNASYCSICLENKHCTVRFKDKDEKEINWFTKLKCILPDVTEVVEDNLICSACTKKIDDFIIFKERLQHFLKRQREIFKKENIFENICASPITFDEASSDGQNLNLPKDEERKDEIQELHEETTPNSNKDEAKESHEENNIVESLICTGCNEGFKNHKKFKLHKRTCSKYKKPTFTCYTCNKTYTSKARLKIHHRICEKDVKREGEEDCTLVVSKKKKGRKSNRSYSCEICNQVFNMIKDLMAHSKNVHGLDEKSVKPYLCNQCPQRFRTYAGFDQHLKYHTKARDNVCSLCGKRFITKSELIVHEYTHFNRRNYKCATCGNAYNTNKNLKTHILVVHTDRSAWKYACNICEKRFPQKGNYDQHMKRHAGDKQHICHICQKPFITSSELKRHMNLHSNVKAFNCEYCQREYKTLRTLQTHLSRSHSVGEKFPEREKKFVCHICPSQFYDKQKLSRHLYCHSGVKPFPCNACEKRFADKSYLKHHMKVAHNVSYQRDDFKYDTVEEVKYETAGDLKYEVPEQLKFDFDGIK